MMILFLAIFSISLLITGHSAAATINIDSSAHYKTTNISLNNQIQKIIFSAKNGDTINFLGSYYGNLSLIVDKSLNIISNSKSTVTGDSTGQPIFLITGQGARWTNITGFKIISKNDGIAVNNARNVTVSMNNVSSTSGTGIKVTKSSGVTVKKNTVSSSKTGISMTNSKNSTVKDNSVKKSTDNGIEVQSSTYMNVNNNSVKYSGKHGTSLSHSNNVVMKYNDIENNGNNGVNLAYTNNVQITNNTINNNKLNGIHFDENVKNTQIILNKINYNLKHGIDLFGSGSNTKINSNLINGNAVGIEVNSATDNLDMSQNIITNSVGNGDDSGFGINFGGKFVNSPTFTVNYNLIYGSQQREVCVGDSDTKINFGYNWYGSDDPSQVRICPYLTTKWITMGTSKLYGFYGSIGIYSVVFYAGNQVATLLPSFDVSFQLNNGTKVTVGTINGTANATFPSSKYQSTKNTVTVTATFEKKKILVADTEVQNIITYQNQQNGGTNNDDPGNGNSNENSGPGNGSGTNSGPGNGQQGGAGDGTSGPGVNQGQSGNAQSSDNSGSTTLVRNSALLGGAGETSESSSNSAKTDDKQSKSAQEIFLDEINNPNLWSIVGLILLIAVIVVIYYRKEIEMMYRK